MSKKRIAAAALAGAALAVPAALAAMAPGGQEGPAQPPPAAAAAAPDPVPAAQPAGPGEVVWRRGPWQAPPGLESAAMLPSSPVHGPLTDLGDGLAGDYPPTAPAAAIAAMRAGLLVAAAPPVLRQRAAGLVLADPGRIPEMGPGLNPGGSWAIPPDWPAVPWPGARMTTLGAVAGLDPGSQPLRAAVDVYTAVTAPQIPPTTWLVSYTLVYREGQWLLQQPDESRPVGVAPAPASYTIRGPLPWEGA